MKKVDGVQIVRVSLNDGMTILDLKPGNAVTLAKLRQIIKNNGFVSKEASVVARGAVAGVGEFVVSGTNERLPLSATAQRSGDDWKLAVRVPDKP
jgi:hypothetical protein